MALPPGSALGPYEILALIGAGGMGEVYRARDPRLKRDVAIKVLPGERFGDESRRRRFVQEAQAASALNHPHIVTIHEIESANRQDFIVMEYVHGKSLDALIPRHGMRLSEVLRVGIAVADALATAHARGIVHRDIKPANVMVGADGMVKVLDFGLAKVLTVETSRDDETTTHVAGASVSVPGSVVGTFAYMSPEQALRETVDARSDIFSLGVMLYEMVAGMRPFAAASTAESLAVLRTPAKPLSTVVPGIPPDFDKVIARCLRRDPDRRFQHAADVRVALQDIKEELDSGAIPAQSHAPSRLTVLARRVRQHPRIAFAATILVLVTLSAVARWITATRQAPTSVQVSSERWAGAGSFSPDGTQVAYASAGDDGINWDIRLKIVGEAESRRLTIDPAAEDFPAWSPDGKQIAFLRYQGRSFRGIPYQSVGTICLISPLGGSARQLSNFPARTELSWSPDGRWLAASKGRSGDEPPGGIYVISIVRGEARAVTFPKLPASDLSPAFSPDGRQLAYASCEGPEGNPMCELWIVALDSDARPLGAARKLPVPLTDVFGLTWSRDGRWIVFSRGALWRVRADGSAAPELLEFGPGQSPSFAGARDRLAFVRGGGAEIYEFQEGGSPRPIIRSAFENFQPQYSPDGRRIAFVSNRAGGIGEIWIADADGSNAVRLTRGFGNQQGSPGWSPDGRTIVFDSRAENGHTDIWTIDSTGSGLRQITRDLAEDILPSFSHQGDFIYFSSNRTGRFEIWRTLASGGPDEQVTRNGGSFSRESWDGRILYYKAGEWNDDRLVGRPTAGGQERTMVPCVAVFGYAVAPHGIFYHQCDTTSATRPLHYLDAATGRDRLVGSIEADWVGGLSVSPDGKKIIYGRGEATSDLMMIENFR